MTTNGSTDRIPSHPFCWECCRRNHILGCDYPCQHDGVPFPILGEPEIVRGYTRPKPRLRLLRNIPKPWLSAVLLLTTSCVSFVVGGLLWDGKGTKDMSVEQAVMLLPVTDDEGSRRALAWLLQDKALRCIDGLDMLADSEDKAAEAARLYLLQIAQEVK